MTVRRVALIFDHKTRPETTGVYCRRALGKLVEVEHVLPSELGRISPRQFDLFLNIDDGLEYVLPQALRPCAWWAIDTHLNPEWCARKAVGFDFVFAAQRDGAARLRVEGIKSAMWLPLACDPEIHRKHEARKRYDVAFVGNLFPGPRTDLVERITQRFENTFVGRRYFEEMAQVYSASRIVFNRSLKNDVNMRVFEALACGSLLVTDELGDNGQDELFENGTHLVAYNGAEDLLERIAYYLANPREREKIAAIGRQEVLVNHTYRNRMDDVLREVNGALSRVSVRVPSTLQAVGTRDPGYFDHARPELLAIIPVTARAVLDIGCGAGRLGEAIKDRQVCEVVGIEYDERAAALAGERLDRVIVGDVERLEPDFAPGQFDAIVCGDILEHLREPERLLRRARRWLRPEGTLLASIPNVRHHSVVRGLLEGNWTYESAGLLDRDHLRFYTRREAEKLFHRTGFSIEELQIIPGPGDHDRMLQGRPTSVEVGRLHIGGMTPDEVDEFYAYQYLISARPARIPDWGLTSIIIITHNEVTYTRLCIESLLRLTDVPVELIFVDNASTDGTADYLRSIPGARVISNAENRGFPAAANQGLAVASGEYLLLLNNDTVVTTGWLDRMLRALERDPTVGVVGPCSNNVSGPQQVDVGYEGLEGLDGFAWDWGKAHDGQVNESDRLVGFCMLFRREVMEAIGTLDERFGIGCFEDDDYCRRAVIAGWRSMIALDAFVHHFGSRTFLGSGADLAHILQENDHRYREKWGEDDPEPGPVALPVDRVTPTEGDEISPDSGSPTWPARLAEPPAPPGRFEVEVAPGGGLLLRPSRINVSLCMIVRDNARTLPACLESIRPWVDEMVVVDTGSIDETPRIAESFGARVFHFPWCDDFAAARNESLRHARGNWLFWMDSDDTIPAASGRRLRELASRDVDSTLLGYVMQVHCPGAGHDGGHDVTVVDHVKLFRNRPDLRFEGRIHEQILPAIRRAGGDVAWTDAYVVHSGSDPGPEAQAKKRARDLRLLHLEDREHPNHPFTLFNLGMTHADGGDFEEAAFHLRRSIAQSSPTESHLRKAYALLVYALAQLGRQKEAAESCDHGLALFPEDAELRFRRGGLLHDLGRLEEAALAYNELLDRPGPRHFTSVVRGIDGFKARQNLAVVYTESGDFASAEHQWQRITEEEPTYHPGWRGLAEVLLRQGKFDQAADSLGRLVRIPGLNGEAALFRGRLAATHGEVGKACAAFREAATALPGDPEPLNLLCQILFHHGRLSEAEASLIELIQLQPGDAAAHHNLGTVRLSMGRYEEAVRSYRESLRLRPDAPATLIELGRALKALDRNGEAADAWRQALKVDPGAEGAIRELEGLETDESLATTAREEGTTPEFRGALQS